MIHQLIRNYHRNNRNQNAEYSAEVVVGTTQKGETVFYDIVDIQHANSPKKAELPSIATTHKAIGDIPGCLANSFVSQTSQKSTPNSNASMQKSPGISKSEMKILNNLNVLVIIVNVDLKARYLKFFFLLFCDKYP